MLPSRSLQSCPAAITRLPSQLQMSNATWVDGIQIASAACRMGRHAAQRYTNLMTRSPLRPTSHQTCLTSRETWVESKNCSAYEPNIHIYISEPNNFMKEALVLNLSQKCALTAKKAISFLHCISCIRQSVTSRSRERILAFCSAQLRHTWNVGSSSGHPNTRETRTY